MVWLCTWLCANKGLNPKKDIIRHTDVVGRAYKLCPIYMVLNEDKYEQFIHVVISQIPSFHPSSF